MFEGAKLWPSSRDEFAKKILNSGMGETSAPHRWVSDIRISGYLGIRVLGYKGIWVHGYMDTSTSLRCVAAH